MQRTAQRLSACCVAAQRLRRASCADTHCMSATAVPETTFKANVCRPRPSSHHEFVLTLKRHGSNARPGCRQALQAEPRLEASGDKRDLRRSAVGREALSAVWRDVNVQVGVVAEHGALQQGLHGSQFRARELRAAAHVNASKSAEHGSRGAGAGAGAGCDVVCVRCCGCEQVRYMHCCRLLPLLCRHVLSLHCVHTHSCEKLPLGS